MRETVAVIGGGAVGRTLGRLLQRAGYPIGGVVCRSEASAREAAGFIGGGRPTTGAEAAAREAQIVLLCVPDEAIEPTARRLKTRALVIHASGLLPASVLGPCGGRVGAIHPLRSFADPAVAAGSFPGTFCFYEGDEPQTLERLVRDCGGRPVPLRGDRKPLYHAGAVFASNYAVAIFEAALRLLEEAGVPRDQAIEPLAALMEGTVANLKRTGPARALTGPIARGEAGPVETHVRAIADPHLAALYKALGRMTLEVAEARELDPAAVERIRRALS